MIIKFVINVNNIYLICTYTNCNHLGYRRGTQIDTEDRVSLLPQPMPLGRLVVEANLAFDTIYLEKYE